MNLKNKHIAELDIIRAFAVLLVMLVHFSVFDFGWVGVQLFFVLSGYLITKNLLHSKSVINKFSIYLKSFYVKRFLRITPAYYFYIFVFLIFLYFNSDLIKIYKLSIPLLSYTLNIYGLNYSRVDFTGIGHFWSLAVEEQFYLIWPFIIFFLNDKLLKKLLIILILIIPFIRLVFFEYAKSQTNDLIFSGEFVNLNTLSHFDAFATGAIIIFFEKKYIKITNIKVITLLLVSTLIFFSIGAYNLELYFKNRDFNKHYILNLGYPHLLINNFQFIYGYTLINIMSAILIFSTIKMPKLLSIFKNKLFILTGKISYGLYLYHIPVLLFTNYLKTKEIIHSNYILLILYFFLTYIISFFSFHKFELYFINLKEKFNPIV